uniref:Rad9 n=1 Tax=Panagrolaimus sp. PS1159 TaxID=55785 RepID=A0AC35G694_9BILA
MRTYDLQAREMSIYYNKSNYNPEQYSNRIECNVLFFKNLFAQLSDNDEMRFQFYPDYSVITKFVDPSNEATSSTLHSMQAAESYERYEIAVPMSMIVSVKQLKVSLKLIGVHSYMASIHFDLGKKPLLITFNDDEKDEQCKVLLAVADVHAITEEEQEERQSESAATQSINNSHRRSQRSHNGYTPADDRSVQQEDEDEPPLKQRKISKAFSFERDSDDESEPHDPRIITPNSNSGNHNYVPLNETPSENQDQYVQPVNNNFSGDNNDSFNNDADFQHPDFDDIPAAPSPSDLPPQREERNSTSPYCLALRMLGIEDQISDIEAPDVLETYDIETTDPNEDLYILSQIPR